MSEDAVEDDCLSSNYTVFTDGCTDTIEARVSGCGCVCRACAQGSAPLSWSVPVYGYMVPAIALGTVACNVCVVAVLTRPHMRTPTNAVLMAIATAQTLCSWVPCVRVRVYGAGISVLPYNVMMFTMHGYESVGSYHLPYIWCRLFNVLRRHLPNIFHGVRVQLVCVRCCYR